MKRVIITYILLSLTIVAYAQQEVVKGKVCDNEMKNIDYFNIELLADTVSILKGSCTDGNLLFNLPENKKYTLKISSMGYEDFFLDIDPNSSNDNYQCILKETSYPIDEVTVTAIRPKIKVRNDEFQLSVDKTRLANEASINNVINKLPFILIDAKNQISVAGKNNVVVYIDNRKVSFGSELENISPSNIKDIRLLNNPGAQYDANADAVILIKTKSQNEENTYFAIKTNGVLGNDFSFGINPNLNYRHKKINLYADYVYSNNKSKEEEINLTYNLKNHNENDTHNNGHNKLHDNTYTIGLSYDFNKNNKLALQLLGWNNVAHTNMEIVSQHTKNAGKDTIETHKEIEAKENHYNFSANYETAFNDLNNLVVSVDYTIHNSNNNETINEQKESTTKRHYYSFEIDNKAVDAQLKYGWSNKKKDLHIDAGAKVSHVSNNSHSEFKDEGNVINPLFTYKYDWKESIPACYVSIDKSYDKITANAGIRFEHTIFKGHLENNEVIDTTYLTPFPNFGINYSINQNSKIGFNYIRKISRPSFKNISPNIRYENVFFYGQGNPKLLPAVTDEMSFTYSFKKFRTSVGFRHKKNATVFDYFQSDKDEDVTVVVLKNHKSMNFIYASCFYQFAVKKFTSSNSLTFTKPFATLEYNGGERKLTKPAYYFKSSNDFAISKNITAYLDFIYNDLGEILLERKESMYNLSCGLICSFMNNRLFVNISANDILDTYNFKDYRNYGYYDVVHEYLPDNTYVRIDLKYVILSGKQVFKVKNNNSSTMSRF